MSATTALAILSSLIVLASLLPIIIVGSYVPPLVRDPGSAVLYLLRVCIGAFLVSLACAIASLAILLHGATS